MSSRKPARLRGTPTTPASGRNPRTTPRRVTMGFRRAALGAAGGAGRLPLFGARGDDDRAGRGSRVALWRPLRSGDRDQLGSGCGDGGADPQASVPDRRQRWWRLAQAQPGEAAGGGSCRPGRAPDRLRTSFCHFRRDVPAETHLVPVPTLSSVWSVAPGRPPDRSRSIRWSTWRTFVRCSSVSCATSSAPIGLLDVTTSHM